MKQKTVTRKTRGLNKSAYLTKNCKM